MRRSRCEVEVQRDTGGVRIVRAVAAVDSGEAVNPDGIRNQIEGGIVQSASWTLAEEVTFDATRVTSLDWGGYPILRFPQVPDRIDVHVIDRPGQPFLGTGEAAQGRPPRRSPTPSPTPPGGACASSRSGRSAARCARGAAGECEGLTPRRDVDEGNPSRRRSAADAEPRRASPDMK